MGNKERGGSVRLSARRDQMIRGLHEIVYISYSYQLAYI